MKPIILFVSAFSLATISVNASAADNLEKIKVCLPNYTQDSLVSVGLAGAEFGYFKEAGFDVEFVQNETFSDQNVMANLKPNAPLFPKKSFLTTDDQKKFLDPEIGKSVAEGQCDIGFTSTYWMLFAGSDFSKFNVAAATIYGDEADIPLIVNKDVKVEHAKDLVGKRIRVGTIPTYLVVYNFMKREKIAANQFTIAYGSPFALGGELASGEVDAGIAYYPTTAMILAEGKAKVAVPNFIKKYLFPFPKSIAIASKKISEEKLAAFRVALKKSADYLNKNPTWVLKLLNRHNKAVGPAYGDHTAATVERGAHYLPPLKLFTMGEKIAYKGKKVSVYSLLAKFEQSFLDGGFTKKKTNLNAWAKAL